MEKKSHIKVEKIISFVIIIIILLVGFIVYSKYNFNDFKKSVREKDKTSFSRDSDIKYSEMKSYKLENKDYNDAMFYESVTVKPNTPYKVTCMVKTENVQNMEQKYIGGAQISIKDTTECSESISGTSDWTKLTLMFNAKNRTSVDLGFRLGGYDEKSKGTAWFSDFKIEEGTLDSDKNWNVACFIIKNLDVNINIDGEITNIKVSMSNNDIYDMESNIKRIPSTIKQMSNENVIMNCNVIEIDTPITSISYDEENEYYIDPGNVKDIIKPYMEEKEYDYIYIAARLGTLNETKNILVHDWIGLGGMDYYGIGFSNIRLPDSSSSYIYKYDARVNTFPEEVFIHEFLHTLERDEKDYGNINLASLHDNAKYNYERDNKEGLRDWYTAYMQNKITNQNGTKAGLTVDAYNSKPVHKSNFKYSYELNQLKEPQNLIEEITSLVKRIKNMF